MTGSFRNSCDVLLLKEEWCSSEGMIGVTKATGVTVVTRLTAVTGDDRGDRQE